MKSTTILVTGCAGFIGSNFVSTFREKFPTTNIVGLDDFSTGRRGAVDPSITFIEGSVLNASLVEKLFRQYKPKYVFHFSAIPRVSYSIEHPIESSEVNIMGTVHLLDAAKNFGTKRFIYSASSSVYGGAKKLPTKESENSPNPRSPYAIQKYVGELYCKTYSDLFEIDSVCLRYFNAFGPGQYGDSPYSSVISSWLEALYLPGKTKPFLEGDGKQTRDFCYIDNVVQANILAMQHKERLGGDVFNIAYGEKTTLNNVRSLIEELSGRQLVLEMRPARIGDVRRSLADISKAKTTLGYNPKVDFKTGLEKTVAWFEARSE